MKSTGTRSAPAGAAGNRTGMQTSPGLAQELVEGAAAATPSSGGGPEAIAADRAAYTRALIAATQPGSSVILATFAVDGPEKCSGLAVRRYDAASLAAELGRDFLPLAAWRETHVTPWGAEQNFQWSVLRRR